MTYVYFGCSLETDNINITSTCNATFHDSKYGMNIYKALASTF